MKKVTLFIFIISIILINYSCFKESDKNYPIKKSTDIEIPKVECGELKFDYQKQKGCDGKTYPDPATSKYILPYPIGVTHNTGLTNCSSSYHSAGNPDRYAFDFNMEVGDSIYATRGGVVDLVINDQPSNGGGAKYGNWLIINHLDLTFGIYLHSPKNGIKVNEGDTIKQGQFVALAGRSGLAGYPHLHFIVVQDSYTYPYNSMPISFKNAYPPDVVLKTGGRYTACK